MGTSSTTQSTTSTTAAKVEQKLPPNEYDDVKSDFDEVNYDEYEDNTEPSILEVPKSSVSKMMAFKKSKNNQNEYLG